MIGTIASSFCVIFDLLYMITSIVILITDYKAISLCYQIYPWCIVSFIITIVDFIENFRHLYYIRFYHPVRNLVASRSALLFFQCDLMVWGIVIYMNIGSVCSDNYTTIYPELFILYKVGFWYLVGLFSLCALFVIAYICYFSVRKLYEYCICLMLVKNLTGKNIMI